MAEAPKQNVQYSEAELRMIHAALTLQCNSLQRAAKKARDENRPAIADAIMNEHTRAHNLLSHTSMLLAVKA